MHKIALKQFMRIVAHGRHLGTHLSQRHCQQFVFSTPAEPVPPAPQRFCHCGEQDCGEKHTTHVHADMPGLAEGDDGLYGPIRQFTRSAEAVDVADTTAEFRLALAVFVADQNGGSHEDAVLPEVVYRTHTMQLSWHNRHGDLEVCMGWKLLSFKICQAYACSNGAVRRLRQKYAKHMPAQVSHQGKYARHMPPSV